MTCLGKTLELEDAEKNYYGWTNHALTTLRQDATRKKRPWHYAQVTERQKRGHPHSHILSTYAPDDLLPLPSTTGHEDYYSAYFERTCIRAGLGWHTSISRVESPERVARYLGKYFFKDMMFETWPRGWHRVRYSRQWPKKEPEGVDFALALINDADWLKLRKMDFRWSTDDLDVFYRARHKLIKVHPPEQQNLSRPPDVEVEGQHRRLNDKKIAIADAGSVH